MWARFCFLLISLILAGCSNSSNRIIETPIVVVEVTSTAYPTSEIPYNELALQQGFINYSDDESVQGTEFTFWMPSKFDSNFGYWVAGDFLSEAASAIDDYAYLIYSENTLFIANDLTFDFDHPANECAEFMPFADELRVEFVIRGGQDQQLASMTIDNYAGLLTNSIESMKWSDVVGSESFYVPGVDSWKIVTNFDPPDRSYHITFIDYILKQGKMIWILTFSVDSNLFWETSYCSYLGDQFDLIARTFEVNIDGK